MTTRVYIAIYQFHIPHFQTINKQKFKTADLMFKYGCFIALFEERADLIIFDFVLRSYTIGYRGRGDYFSIKKFLNMYFNVAEHPCRSVS